MTFFETIVDSFKEFLGQGWVKELSEDEDKAVFSKEGQAISFVICSSVNTPRFKVLDCVAKKTMMHRRRMKTTTLREQSGFAYMGGRDPIRVRFDGYETPPVYDSKKDAVRAFIESVL